MGALSLPPCKRSEHLSPPDFSFLLEKSRHVARRGRVGVPMRRWDRGWRGWGLIPLPDALARIGPPSSTHGLRRRLPRAQRQAQPLGIRDLGANRDLGC